MSLGLDLPHRVSMCPALRVNNMLPFNTYPVANALPTEDIGHRVYIEKSGGCIKPCLIEFFTNTGGGGGERERRANLSNSVNGVTMKVIELSATDYRGCGDNTVDLKRRADNRLAAV